MFSLAYSPDSERLVVNKSVLVSGLYSTITSRLADVFDIFLSLYWECRIDNVVIHTLQGFRHLGGHGHFSKC